jgi:hypothetical protein
MAAATDPQMQAYADNRIRTRAEAARALVNALRDDKAAVDDAYARATSAARWNDARTDGPPHLLQSGNSANPDDLLNYNVWVSALLNLLDGTSVANGSTVAADAATVKNNWAVFQRACVRAL